MGSCAYDKTRVSLVTGRTPLLPLEAIVEIFESDDPLQRLRAFVASNPSVRQAIFVSSPSLSNALDQWLSRESPRNLRAPLRALAYVDRMSFRPTPFGICAGVGMVGTGNRTTLEVDTESRSTHTRPDMALLVQAAKQLESGENREAVRYVTNRAVLERGDRLYVTHIELCSFTSDGKEASAEQRPVSLKNTAAVRFVRELANQPRSYRDIKAALVEHFRADDDDAQRVLDRLIEAGVLISELRPSPIGDAVTYMLNCFDAVDADAAGDLRIAIGHARTLDERPLKARALDDYRLTSAHFSGLVPQPPPRSIHVDLHSPFRGAINHRLLADAAQLGEYWTRMAPIGRLAKLRARFETHYEGGDRMVPLLELVDPNIGLGHTESVEPQAMDYAQRDAAVLRIACEALRTRAEEAELTDEDLALIIPPLADGVTVDPLEVSFHVIAGCPSAVDSGDYLIVPGTFFVSYGAGRSLGRFAHVLSDGIVGRLETVARESETEEALTAELVYVPAHGLAYNVSIRPPICNAELRVGVGSPATADEIPLDDLWVGLEEERFVLWSHSRGRRIAVRESHLFATERNAPNVCRFLASLADDGRPFIRPFDWGAAARLTYLPRVRTGRIVLSPRRWLFDAKRLGKSSIEAAANLRKWRADWNLPRYVMLVDFDNALLLDLDSSIAADLLLDQLPSDSQDIRLVEAFSTPDNAWIVGEGGRYAVEFVASILPKSGVRKRRTASKWPNGKAAGGTASPRKRFGLGSQWIYLKLYMAPQATDDFIVRSVLPLIAELRACGKLERWFYLRYADPRPHLRVRVRAPHECDETVRQRIIAGAEDWLQRDQVLTYAFDTYEPEYERYGKAADLERTEQFFMVDSDLCAALLSQTPDTADARVEASVESFLPFLENTETEACLEAFDSRERFVLSPADRAARKRLHEVWPQSGREGNGAEGFAFARETLPSYFHMHCNRLGLSRASEVRAVALLRSVLVARRARASQAVV